jgi:hypothetical protein
MTDLQLGQEWRPISSAPKDGTAIQVIIPGHGADNIVAFQWGLVGEDGEDCGAWTFVSEQDPPECWTDGWCWEVNEDGVRSAWPTHWKPAPVCCAVCATTGYACDCPELEAAGLIPSTERR